jgi:hypothetical protein
MASKLLVTFVEPKVTSFWSLTLPVAAEGGVHAGAVENGLAAVEVDDLSEREGASDEVGGGVFETPRVGRSDGVADVGGEAGMSPGEQLLDELGRDGMGKDRSRPPSCRRRS